MSNNLKTLKTDYVANRRVRQYGGRLNTKQYNAYNRMPDMITTNNNYYWEQGFNKRYGRHALLVKPNAVNDQLNNFTLKIDRQLQMTDFYYDNVSKKDLKLIRQRFKKAPMNLKGYNAIVKDYSHSRHRYTYIHIAWVIDDRYIINDISDFIALLKERAI